MQQTVLISMPLAQLQTLIIDSVNACLDVRYIPIKNNCIENDIIEIDEAANITKYSKPAIYAYIKRGQIPYIRATGRKILFSKKALEDWLQQGRKLTLSEIQRQSEREPLPTQ